LSTDNITDDGPAIVETEWRKSSYSGGNSDNCVEFKRRGDLVLLRDTEDSMNGILAIKRGSWDAFLAGIKAGELDQL